MSVLEFKHSGKKYKSKPFDFEAMCLINEKQNDNAKGPLRLCTEAVDYLFEDVEGVNLNELEPGVRAKLCAECWQMYVAEYNRKND